MALVVNHIWVPLYPPTGNFSTALPPGGPMGSYGISSVSAGAAVCIACREQRPEGDRKDGECPVLTKEKQ